MNPKPILSLFVIASFGLLLGCSESDALPSGPAPLDSTSQASSSDPGSTILEFSTFESSKGIFQHIVYLDSDDELHEEFLDLDGNPVDEGDAIDQGVTSLIEEDLEEYIARATLDPTLPRTVEVVISLLDDPDLDELIPDEDIEIDSETGLVYLDGRLASDTDIVGVEGQLADYHEMVRDTIESKRIALIEEIFDIEEWPITEAEVAELASGYELIVREMHVFDIHDFISRHMTRVSAIGFYMPLDIGMTSSTHHSTIPFAQGPNQTGDGIGIFMTEKGCAPTSAFSNYTQLSGSDSAHSRKVIEILQTVSPDAHVYCAKSLRLPKKSELKNPPNNGPPIRAVHTSAGWGKEKYVAHDKRWDNFVYNHGISAIVAAGNLKDGVTHVSSPAKGLNILAVGNYSTATQTIDPSSCWMNPTNTNNEKPELSAPGNLTLGSGKTCLGTSCSAPIVTGMITNYMQDKKMLQTRPHAARAAILAGAVKPVAGNPMGPGDLKVGVGGVDYGYFTGRGKTRAWQGKNSRFATLAANDGGPSSTTLDVPLPIHPSDAGVRIRVALSWLNRGTWTYKNRNEFRSMGRDFNLRVTDSAGNRLAMSNTSNASFEVLDFVPPSGGTYWIRIASPEFRHEDTKANLRLGLAWRFID